MDHQLVQEIYAANVQPERFEELLTSWEEKILTSSGFESTLQHPEILTHIRQAVSMFQYFDPNSDAGLTTKAIDGPYPVIVCNARGEILLSNPSAQDRYGVDRISALPFEPATMQSLLAAVSRMAKNSDSAPAVISAQKATPEAPSVVAIQPYLGTGAPGAGLVQVTTNDFSWPDGLNGILEQTFQLSSAECAVMQLMAEGASVSDVAQMRGSSVATVRVQVRGIYDKVGVRNQAEMLRLAIGFVNVFNLTGEPGDDDTRTPGRFRPHASERQTLTLEDGRKLSFTDLGDSSGLPVLVLHDEYYGDLWPARSIQRATELGLRIITPARPFFGQSDGYPADVIAAEHFASDVQMLLEHLGVDDFIALARRTGFRFAVQMAHQITRLVGIVALSPAIPAQSKDEYRDMTRFARFISHAIFDNPALVELACQAGIRYYKHMGAKKFAHMLNKGSQTDLAILEDPEQWPLIKMGMQFASTNGHLGYLHDVLHDPAQAWQKTIDCPVPINCLIGTEDPHDRLRRANRCIAAGADMSVQTLDEAAQLFFYSHTDVVLDAVNASWEQIVTSSADCVSHSSQF